MENNHQEQQIQEELSTIDALLHDTAFIVAITGKQEAAYYKALVRQPAFEPPAGDIVRKRGREEKMAIYLAHFYAVECSIGALTAINGSTPIHWLRQIANKSLDADSQLLLYCFAGATSMTCLPFLGLNRIKHRQPITLLLSEPLQTYHDTLITATASKLLDTLQDVSDTTAQQQWEKIGHLLQDRQYATDVVQHLQASIASPAKYLSTMNLTVADDTQTVTRKASEEKVAINAAGLYAVAYGLSYLSWFYHQLPSGILNAIVTGTLRKQDQELLERLANATWKACQPFRGLDRITRDVFRPFDLLPLAEIEKDWVQVQAAATAILQYW